MEKAQELLQQGTQAYKQKQYEQALSIADSCLETIQEEEEGKKCKVGESVEREAQLLKGKTFLKMRDMEMLVLMEECFERVLQLDPHDVEGLVGMGYTLLLESDVGFDNDGELCQVDDEKEKSARIRDALLCYQTAFTVAPGNKKVLVFGQSLFAKINLFKKALQCSNQAFQVAPHSTSVLLSRAALLMNLKRAQLFHHHSACDHHHNHKQHHHHNHHHHKHHHHHHHNHDKKSHPGNDSLISEQKEPENHEGAEHDEEKTMEEPKQLDEQVLSCLQEIIDRNNKHEEAWFLKSQFHLMNGDNTKATQCLEVVSQLKGQHAETAKLLKKKHGSF